MTIRVPIAFGRLMRLEADRTSSIHSVQQRAARMFGHDPALAQKAVAEYEANGRYAQTINKANEVPAIHADGAYGSETVASAGYDFAKYVQQAATCLGQLNPLTLPLGIRGGTFVAGATASTVTPGNAIPVQSSGAASLDLQRNYAAIIEVASYELLMTQGIERALVLQAAQAVGLEIEASLFSPARTTSVAYGGLSVAAHDSTPFGLFGAIVEAFTLMTAAQASTTVLLLNDRNRFALSMLHEANSGTRFMDQDGRIGTLRTLPTAGLPSGTGLLVDAAQLGIGIEAAAVAASNSANIEMRTVPTQSAVSLPPVATTTVSMFTSDSRALKIVTPYGGKMLRAGAACAITGIEANLLDHS